MKKIKIVVIFLAAILFIMIPLPADKLYLRLHFMDAIGGDCELFYATAAADFNPEQYQRASIVSDENGSRVTFCLDGSLKDEITRLRIDFPAGDEMHSVSNITVSSAGIVQKQFIPSNFFAGDNVSMKNDISDISLATAQNRAYVVTAGEDPFVVLSEGITDQILSGYSQYRLTRLAICLFLGGCYLMYRKKFFD